MRASRTKLSSLAAGLVAVACLLLPAVTQAAEPADPLIPRSEMLTVDEIRPGMTGLGKSVFRGTRVENFGVTVLGVLRHVDFGGDIILVRIDSGPPVSQGFGVVSGMSGSPIYINGKLIGALAYTWPFAERPIAGVTPIAQMLEAYLPGSSPVAREGALEAVEPFLIDGARIERGVVAPAPEAAAPYRASNTVALVPVSTPLLVSGLRPSDLSLLRTALEPLGLVPLAGAGSMAHIDAEMVPGAAVGARLVGGDLDMTAVGTVTYVKDGVVLAFGHPMSSLGTTDLPLVAAYVHGVMPSAELSFKLASGGQTLGRFTEDRPWCLGGRLGEMAALVDTTFAIADRDRGVQRRYEVQVVRNRDLTTMLLTGLLAGAIGSVGPPTEGSTRVRFSLDAEGLPHMERENTYAMEGEDGLLALLFGSSAAATSATDELSQILDVLQSSEFGEARVSRLVVTVELSRTRRLARLERAQITQPRVRPGEEVEVVITLRAGNAGQITRTERIRVPENCPPGSLRLGIAGGRSADMLRSHLEISDPSPASMGQMMAQMLDRPSNDDLVVQLALPTVGIEARGFAFRDLPPAVIEVLRSAAATRLRPLRDYVEQRSSTEWVISGATVLTLTVEGEEPDKGGRPPRPEFREPMFEEVSPGLAGLFSSFGLRASLQALAQSGSLPEPNLESPPPMPTWEDVEDVTTSGPPSGPSATQAGVVSARREALGRTAEIWRLTSQTDFASGEVDGLAVVSTGGLALGPQASVLDIVSAQCLWPIAVGPDGSVYTGTWTDGCLRRTTPDGDTDVLLATEDAAIQAIAVADDGTVYAAAAPSGTIYRISPGQDPEQLCRIDAQDVWALAFTTSGDLWAATGPDGRLYRISPDGVATVAFVAADRHIADLAVGPDDTLYLATSPRGKVYAVAPDGSARSLHEIDRYAAQSVAVDSEGNVYVGTSPGGRVLKIGADGVVQEVLRVRARHVLSLQAAPDGAVYAATGPEARVYVIRPDRSYAELYDPETAFVTRIASDSAGALYLAAADTGRIIKLDPVAPRTGNFTSAVHDAGAVARWGAVRWQGHAPDETRVRIATRSGGTAHPDATWSEWRETGLTSTSASPPARFLQCRVEVEGRGPTTAEIDSVEISCLPANRPPQVALSTPTGDEIWSGRNSIRWAGRDPDGDRITYEVYRSSDRGETWTPVQATDAPVEEGPAEEIARRTPALTDPQQAYLVQGRTDRPSLRRATAAGLTEPMAAVTAAPVAAPGLEEEELVEPDEAPTWEADEDEGVGEEEVPLARPAGPPAVATRLEWDTTSVPDGIYWIKVVATDRSSNPADACEVESVSQAFTVDNTPPELILDRRRADDDPPPDSLTVFDRTTYITSAEFRVDGGDWLAATAGDGIFDGQFEAILLDRDRLPEAAHAVEIRARDAAGSVANITLRYRR